VRRRGPSAWRDLGPQFPGATLLFVRALEELVGLPRLPAFDLAERASRRAGLECAFHIDDKLGEHGADRLDDAGLVDLAAHYRGGCGYAQVVWGDEIGAVIEVARGRGWRFYVSAGPHSEQGATINRVRGTTFNATRAARVGRVTSIWTLRKPRCVRPPGSPAGPSGFRPWRACVAEASYRRDRAVGGVPRPET